MRKLWTVFRLVMILPVAAAAAGGILAAAGSALAGIILILAGAVMACWWYMYFITLDYDLIDGEIFLRGGVLIKKRKRLSENNILWTNSVKLLGIPLLTVLHTSGGSMVIFAEAELFDDLSA